MTDNAPQVPLTDDRETNGEDTYIPPYDPVSDKAFQQTPAGSTLAKIDKYMGLGWLTQPKEAAFKAFDDITSEPLGLSEDTQQNLRDVGWFNDYSKGEDNWGKSVLEGVLKPAAAAAGFGMRSVYAPTAAAVAGVGEALTGEPPERAARHAEDFTQFLYINSGFTESGTPLEANAGPTMQEPAGPPQLDVPIKPENPAIDKSGNLNLDYIKADGDVKEALATTAQAYAEKNGTVVSHAETTAEAQKFLDGAMKNAAGGIPDVLADYNRGDPVNRPLLYSARQLVVQSASDAVNLAKTAAKTGDPADLSAALDAAGRMEMLNGTRHEISAEAGRTLESHKIPIGDEGIDLEKLPDKLSGLTPEEKVKVMASLDTPQELARFVQDTHKPAFSDMGLFYVFNNYLSGPITHAAYTASWAAQTVIRAGIETPIASMVGRIQDAFGKTLEPEEFQALQQERSKISDRLAEADSSQGRKLKASESVQMEARLKKLNTQLRNATTVLPGEAKARLYGIGQGAMDSIRGAWRAMKSSNIQMLPGERAIAELARKAAEDAAKEAGKSPEKATELGQRAYDRKAFTFTNPVVAASENGFTFLGKDVKVPENLAPALKAVGNIVGVPTRVIAAIHTLQKFSGYAETTNALAYRQAVMEGLEKPEEIGARIAQIKADMPEDMMRQGAEEAKYAALMGRPGVFGQALENLSHATPWARMVIPFARVVSNLTSQKLLERTPLGLVAPKVVSDLLGKNGNEAQAWAVARMTSGSILLAAGAWLRAQGITTGQAPTDPKDKAFKYLSGQPPYSVRIDGMMVPDRFFGVPGGSLSLGADIFDIHQKAMKEEDSFMTVAIASHMLGNDLLNENALKGYNDLMEAIKDNSKDQTTAKAYWANALSAAFVPFSVGQAQVTRTLDNTMRQTHSPGISFSDRLGQTIQSRTPFASRFMVPDVDIFGNPMQRNTNYAAAMKDPVMQELQRLQFFPARVEQRLSNVKLSEQQYFDYQGVAGKLFHMNLANKIADPHWSQLKPESQINDIKQVIKEARKRAKCTMWMKYPELNHAACQQNLDLTDPE